MSAHGNANNNKAGGLITTDRDRLIELIIEAKKTDPETGSFNDYLADYLLEHGVIVTPVGWENMRKEDERK